MAQVSGAGGAATMTPQQEFLSVFAPLAQKEQERSGLPASLLLAQLIQESGWKLSELASKYNNFFGIKASRDWDGLTVYMTNKAGTDSGVYRVYETPEAGFAGRTEFFQKNPRYSNLLKMDDPYKMADELQRVGYATDPNYASALKNIIKSYNLTQYDKGSAGEKTLWDLPGNIDSTAPDAMHQTVGGGNQTWFESLATSIYRGIARVTLPKEKFDELGAKTYNYELFGDTVGEQLVEAGTSIKRGIGSTVILIILAVIAGLLVYKLIIGGAVNGGTSSASD